MPSNAAWQGVGFGNGVFSANAQSTTAAASSTDGITWTLRTMPAAEQWRKPVFGNGTFVSVGRSGGGTLNAAATSPDGITWTLRTTPDYGSWSTVAYGNGIFLALAYGNNISITSTNGISWTKRSVPLADNWITADFISPAYASPAINNLYKNITIAANQSQVLQPGITLGAQNSIVVRGTSNLTFSTYGTELS
jgi:hypothetical protein